MTPVAARQRARRWRLRALAVVLGLTIEALLVGLMFFSQRAPPPAADTSLAVIITTLPRLRDEPPPEQPEPPPRDEREEEREDDPRPARIPPLNTLPTQAQSPPGLASGATGNDGEARAAGSESSGVPRRLNLGCLGRSYEFMTPQERRDCENQAARTSGIPGKGEAEFIPPTGTQAGYEADGRRRDARNQPVYPSGNRTSIGCPEGNMTACVDGMMNEIWERRF